MASRRTVCPTQYRLSYPGPCGQPNPTLFYGSVWPLVPALLPVTQTQQIGSFRRVTNARQFHISSLCVCVLSLVCMVWVIFVYVDTVYEFSRYSFFMVSLMFQHDDLDTCCFESLICMCVVFVHLHLFSAIEHVSPGKALYKNAHYYYYHYYYYCYYYPGMDRAAQVTNFRLRTGHCQLLSHLQRLNISYSDKCPCGTGPQTPTTS